MAENNKKEKGSSGINRIMEKADGVIESTARELFNELKQGCKTYGELRGKISELHRMDGNKDRYAITREVKEMFDREVDNILLAKTWYLCDGKKPGCRESRCYLHGGECRHTSDIAHAANFSGKSKGGDISSYWEKERIEDLP